jgi:hypothetical protein
MRKIDRWIADVGGWHVGMSHSPTYNWTKPSVQTHHTTTNQIRLTRAMVGCDMKTCSAAGEEAECMRFTQDEEMRCGNCWDALHLSFGVDVDVARTLRRSEGSGRDRRQGSRASHVLILHTDFKARRYTKQGKETGKWNDA